MVSREQLRAPSTWVDRHPSVEGWLADAFGAVVGLTAASLLLRYIPGQEDRAVTAGQARREAGRSSELSPAPTVAWPTRATDVTEENGRDDDPRELQTERLILRPFRLDDAGDVFACANDDEWDRYFYTAVPHPFGRRDAEEYVAGRLLAPWDENPTFAIVLDGTVIGGIEVHVDAQNQVAEVSYSVVRQHWGKGLTEEAVSAVIDYASGALGLARVYAAADAHLGSWRVWRRSA